MSKLYVLASGVLFASAAALLGCSSQPDSPPAASGEAGSSAQVAQTDPEIEKALAQLSPKDRQLAEKQKICPVSGEPLGSMGPPLKVHVEGRDVLVCCAGCDDAVKENPGKYLSKLMNQ